MTIFIMSHVTSTVRTKETCRLAQNVDFY